MSLLMGSRKDIKKFWVFRQIMNAVVVVSMVCLASFLSLVGIPTNIQK